VSGPWAASIVVLWMLVAVLGFAVVVLLRQVGVLHARLAPLGAHPAGQGPAVGDRAPLASPAGYAAPRTLVAFTARNCKACAALRPALTAVEREYDDLALLELELGPDTAATFRAFNVADTPYAVVVDGEGVVQGGGVVNTLEQIEELLDVAPR
jgi:thiol-disulfide isomerase/thioredoxin